MTIDEVRDIASLFTEYMKAKTIIEKMKFYSVYDNRYGDISRYSYQDHVICYDVICNIIIIFEPICTEDGYTHLVTKYRLSDYGKTWSMSKEELEMYQRRILK